MLKDELAIYLTPSMHPKSRATPTADKETQTQMSINPETPRYDQSNTLRATLYQESPASPQSNTQHGRKQIREKKRPGDICVTSVLDKKRKEAEKIAKAK
jgi:hypothetical protein